MKDLVEYIAKSIVNSPDDVVATEETTEDEGILIKLQVADDDKGRIIGKQGKIIKAIRNLLKIKAIKENKRFSLNLKEEQNL